MHRSATRRDFLRASVAAGGLTGLGDLAFLSGLPAVRAEDTRLPKNAVQLSPAIEPIVRLLEETPREQLLEVMAAKIRAGLTYPEVLAALLLAGVRNVQPRPHVGFKFHAVLVVNSAHLASLASPDEYRWLPIFWALDYFKEAQADDAREGDWTMLAVDPARLPSPENARQAFVDALNNWDAEAADAAAAALARTAKPDEIYELLYAFGCRDFRDIGHKAIYVANSRRTLEQIGWEHLEPVLRSLAYALVRYDGENPARADHPEDRPGRKNLERAKELRANLTDGQPAEGATRELLATLRAGSADDVCDQAIAMLNRGVAATSVWDAFFLGAGELLGRQPGIVALHAVTSTNALHYAFTASKNDDTRKLLLLQNAAFLPLFREAMKGRGRVRDWNIDALEPVSPKTVGKEGLAEIFTDVAHDRGLAAAKTVAYLANHPDPRELIDAARLLIFFKGNNAHDYKFSSAVLEDQAAVSPAFRSRYLAASMFQLRGSAMPDNDLVKRTRAALAG
jgi:hypothetical protein